MRRALALAALLCLINVAEVAFLELFGLKTFIGAIVLCLLAAIKFNSYR